VEVRPSTQEKRIPNFIANGPQYSRRDGRSASGCWFVRPVPCRWASPSDVHCKPSIDNRKYEKVNGLLIQKNGNCVSTKNPMALIPGTTNTQLYHNGLGEVSALCNVTLTCHYLQNYCLDAIEEISVTPDPKYQHNEPINFIYFTSLKPDRPNFKWQPSRKKLALCDGTVALIGSVASWIFK